MMQMACPHNSVRAMVCMYVITACNMKKKLYKKLRATIQFGQETHPIELIDGGILRTYNFLENDQLRVIWSHFGGLRDTDIFKLVQFSNQAKHLQKHLSLV